MKKEKLPIDFLTSTISKGWDEVGNIKSSIKGIQNSFTETEKIEKILQDLVDAYLICIGQLESFLDKKDYVDMPDTDKINEAKTSNAKYTLTESTVIPISELPIEMSSNVNTIPTEVCVTKVSEPVAVTLTIPEESISDVIEEPNPCYTMPNYTRTDATDNCAEDDCFIVDFAEPDLGDDTEMDDARRWLSQHPLV